MNRYQTFLFGLMIILIGCGASDDIEYAYPQLELKLAPGIPQQALNVNRIEVTVVGTGFASIVQEFSPQSNERRLDVSLFIPLDATVLRVEVFEIDDSGEEHAAFRGESRLEQLDATNPKITVLLNPVTHLNLTTSKTELTVGEIFAVEISVAEVTNLFAVTLEVIFDNQRLAPVDILAGPFFGTNPILFDDRGLSETTNRLGIAIAQRGGSTGVTDSGIAAVINFQATAPGSATIRVAQKTESDVFTLQQPNGEVIADFERLEEFLTRASVTVNVR